MAPFSSISPFSFSSFSFFSFPLPDRAFPLRGKKKKKEKALLVWPVLARFPRSTAFHGLTFCVPGERPLVAFIAVIIRPPPTWTTAWKEPADRLAHVSPGKRARKKDTPPPPSLPPPPPPPFRRPLRSQDLGISTGSMHSWTGRMGLGGGCDWSRGGGRVGGSVWMEARRKD